MSDKFKKVFVLGAGFTKAFLSAAPLLVDHYPIENLRDMFKGFESAKLILDSELSRNRNQHINIERLMTRLYGKMPYDEAEAQSQINLLLLNIKKVFLNKLEEAKSSEYYREEMDKFAEYCVENKVNCITFNYDDFFDESLWAVKKQLNIGDGINYWHPDGGYGFFCRNSRICLGETVPSVYDKTSMLLLKLHGSVNWRIRQGVNPPYTIDNIIHHQSWLPHSEDIVFDEEIISRHLEKEPFFVPPILSKSMLTEHPILRLVWSLAFNFLREAEEVVFIGYSFPDTDIAANFLFFETLYKKIDKIKVVNFAYDPKTRKQIITRYKNVFPGITNNQFEFNGALEWTKNLLGSTNQPSVVHLA